MNKLGELKDRINEWHKAYDEGSVQKEDLAIDRLGKFFDRGTAEQVKKLIEAAKEARRRTEYAINTTPHDEPTLNLEKIEDALGEALKSFTEEQE